MAKVPDPVPPFNSLLTLELDGRDVVFDSDAGPYVASAVAASLMTESRAAIENKYWAHRPDGSFGYWPDILYQPTGWAEVGDVPLPKDKSHADSSG